MPCKADAEAVFLAISDQTLQRQMLLQTINDANSARAELAFQIKSDIFLLGGEKTPYIKQVLLKEIEYKNNKHIAWNLICSSGNSGFVPQEFYSLPMKLVNSCVAFIEDKNENLTICLEGEPNK